MRTTGIFAQIAWLFVTMLLFACTKVGVYAASFAYTSDTANGAVSEFAVRADGRFQRIGRFLLPGKATQRQRPAGIALSPNGRFLYAANLDGGCLLQFRVNPSGSLTPLSPAAVPVSPEPTAITLAPSGHFLYVSARNAIFQFRIQTDGTLAPLSPATVLGGNIAADSGEMAVSPDGDFLYAIAWNIAYRHTFDGADLMLQYAIRNDGTLALLHPAIVSAGSKPYSIAISRNGRFAYVADFGDNLILQYGLHPDGTLHRLRPPSLVADPSSPGPGDINPFWVAVAPNQRFVYMANIGNSTIAQYRILADGTLSALHLPWAHTGQHPNCMAFGGPYGETYVSCSGRVERFRADVQGRLHKLTPAYAEKGWYPAHLVFCSKTD